MMMDFEELDFVQPHKRVGKLISVDVLDKIRAEIKQAFCIATNDYGKGINYGLHIATQIIDKYKTESEDKE